ncbi:hypothetical protein AVEN_112963-1 [Araneus ventricosus]|uniref:Uncharacterized protein n=1 Tax=Araneus ventricosus TaxID=182803 RepID=A0A4Y2QRI6_ARAVE|nr:hypothetical protein AVEN_1483-1 [Araneus ventricosus]GBN66074.1 hypothetical protein AVEN_112963-1 [Araneus ventricosus]
MNPNVNLKKETPTEGDAKRDIEKLSKELLKQEKQQKKQNVKEQKKQEREGRKQQNKERSSLLAKGRYRHAEPGTRSVKPPSPTKHLHKISSIPRLSQVKKEKEN